MNKLTVKDLIEQLKECPQDADVLLQKDPEGNGYMWCSGASSDGIIEDGDENEYAIDQIYSDEWTAEDACMSEDEWKEILQKPRTVVLFP